MPRPSIRTVMLEELTAHHRVLQRQRFQRTISELLSDLSETDSSDSSHFSIGSPISIDTPDILATSDISMSSMSDHITSTSESTGSDMSISNFEAEYY